MERIVTQSTRADEKKIMRKDLCGKTKKFPRRPNKLKNLPLNLTPNFIFSNFFSKFCLDIMKVAVVLVLCVALAAAQTSFRVNSFTNLLKQEQLCKITDRANCPWEPVFTDPIVLHVAGSANKRFLTIPVSGLASIFTDTLDVDHDNTVGTGAMAKVEGKIVVTEKQNDGSYIEVPSIPSHVTLFEQAQVLIMSTSDVECLDVNYDQQGCNNGTAMNPKDCCDEAINLLTQDSVASSYQFFAYPFKTGDVTINMYWRALYDETKTGRAGASFGPVSYSVYTGQLSEWDDCVDESGPDCDL